MEQESAEKFIILFTSKNNEVAFGPFDSIENAWENLTRLGFERATAIWYRKANVDAYIRQLNSPDEIAR